MTGTDAQHPTATATSDPTSGLATSGLATSSLSTGRPDGTGAATTGPTGPFTTRAGGAADAPLIVALFNEAVAWQVERGLASQWGPEPFSADPRKVAAASRWAESGGLVVAERHGEPVAVMVLGEAPAYAPPATGPELYVVVLVASRRPEARGAGRFLLAEAEETTRRRGLPTLRLDCYAGNDGALVAYYRSAGFEPTETFLVGEWPGQVLQRSVG